MQGQKISLLCPPGPFLGRIVLLFTPSRPKPKPFLRPFYLVFCPCILNVTHMAAPAQEIVKWFSKPGEHSARQETPSAGSATFPGPRGSLISLRKCLKCENSKEEQESLILVPNVLLAILRRNRKWKKQFQLIPPRQSFHFLLCTPPPPGTASNSVFPLSQTVLSFALTFFKQF